MNVDDFIKFIELTKPLGEQELIKTSISDFNLFLSEFKYKEDVEEEELIKYDNVIIYQIKCKDLNITDCYVGYTKKELKERKYHHEKTCNTPTYRYYNKYLYQFIRTHGGFENWEMIEIENCLCKTNFEAREREQYWYNTLNSTLNKIRPQK